MACSEIDKAIDWSKQTSSAEQYPVIAYFTKHFAPASDSTPFTKDAVHYASGEVVAVDGPMPHLKGTLNASVNTTTAGQMVPSSHLTYDVEIYPSGKVIYLQKSDSHPIAGLPPTQVQATCVAGHLLTATTGSEVIAVGVSRQASIPAPPK